MAQEGKEIVQALIERFPVCITYIPTKSEVDFNALTHIDADVYVIQPNRYLDPTREVAQAMSVARGRETAVLIPGRTFDAAGTRHGKGAGWYDRFLTAVPASWTRIGFCFEQQFSKELLVRKPWDEPMDYLVVVNQGKPTLYETCARPGILKPCST